MSQELLVFINGYRGPKHDKELPDNQIHFKDPTGYWYKLDDTIQQRFPNSKAVAPELTFKTCPAVPKGGTSLASVILKLANLECTISYYF